MMKWTDVNENDKNFMFLEINEEEKTFLERICERAIKLAFFSKDKIDLEKINILKNKLNSLKMEDSVILKKETENK